MAGDLRGLFPARSARSSRPAALAGKNAPAATAWGSDAQSD